MNKAELDAMKSQVADIRNRHKEVFVAVRLYKMLKKATEALEAQLTASDTKPKPEPKPKVVEAPFGFLANGEPRKRRPYKRRKAKKVTQVISEAATN